MERTRTAVRLALISFGFRVHYMRNVRRLLLETDAVDTLIYQLEMPLFEDSDTPFLDFIRELIEMFLEDPKKIIDLIITIIELFSDSEPNSVPEPPR